MVEERTLGHASEVRYLARPRACKSLLRKQLASRGKQGVAGLGGMGGGTSWHGPALAALTTVYSLYT
jgi:hypothetical protein